jgi:integrase/recombinase XerD
MGDLIKKTPKVLQKLKELEFFANSGDGIRLNLEFLKNFNSEETRKAYYADLKHFFQFYKMAFNKTLRHPNQVKRAHVIAYKDFLIDCGGHDGEKASNLTVRRKMATLSSYFKFMMENGVMEYNPVEGIKRPRKTPKKGTEALSENQVRLLLDFMDMEAITNDDFKTHMHRTIIYLLFFTGIRVSEVINIKRMDYFTYRGMPAVKIKSKGDKFRIVPIHDELKTIIDNYLKVLRKTLREKEKRILEARDYIFFSLMNNKNKNRKNLSRYGVYKILNERAFQAGIRGKISPHSARATLITTLLDQGQDLYRVSHSVGHANPETTKIYDKRNRSVKDNAILDLNY